MNILFVLFAGVILVTIGLLTIYGLSGTPLEDDVSVENSKESSASTLKPFPKQSYRDDPSFRSMTVVQSARAFKYDASKQRITLGDEPNMRKWGISYPLNFTHAKISGDKIYEFRYPNTSDSTGRFLTGSQQTNFTFNTIEFGMFF